MATSGRGTPMVLIVLVAFFRIVEGGAADPPAETPRRWWPMKVVLKRTGASLRAISHRRTICRL